eukprot:gene13713-11112_t
MVLTLAAWGHLVDPRQIVPFQRIMTLHRMLQQGPDGAELIRPAWEATRQAPAQNVPGPVGCVRESLRSIGWDWPSPERLQPPGDAPALVLTAVEPGRLAHDVRE